MRGRQLLHRAALALEYGSEESSFLTEVTQHAGQHTQERAGGSYRQGGNADCWR